MRRPPNLWRHPKTGIWYLRTYKADGTDGPRRSLGTRDLREAASKAPSVREKLGRELPRLSASKEHWLKLAAADVAERKSLGAKPYHLKQLEAKWLVIIRNLSDERGPDVFSYDDAIAYIALRRSQTWQGETIRGQTIYRETAAIWRALKIAKRRGLRHEMPDEWPKVKRSPQHVGKTGKHREPELIRKYLMALHQDARDEVIVDAMTQLRATELKRLEKSHIKKAPKGSETKWIIALPDSATKIGEPRIVGLPDMAYQIIQRRLRESPESKTIFSKSDFKKHRRIVSRKLGLTHTITLRDLRHTFSTEALALTNDATAVMRSAGHKDLRTTEKYLSTTVKRSTAVAAAAARALKPDHLTRITKDGLMTTKALKAPRKSGKSTSRLERAMGLEPTTLSLGMRGAGKLRKKNKHLRSAAIPKRPARHWRVSGKPDHLTGSPARGGAR